MNDTSLSLLKRLGSSPEPEAWKRLLGIYAPLLKSWLRKYQVQDSDADDLMQEVMMAITKDLKSFDHQGQPGAFRGWLKKILVNRLRNFWRARDRRARAEGDSGMESRLAQLDDPASDMSLIWDQQHDDFVLRQLLALAQPSFSATTWKAFCRVTLDGVRADVVARELEITTNAVFIAKSRVLSKLRQDAAGLVESSLDYQEKS